MGQIGAAVVLFVLLIAASGCISDGKSVIKAKVLVAEDDEGNPEIVSTDVSTETASILRKYQDAPMNTPGVYMKCIHNPQDRGAFIGYWRSVSYTGPGEYELMSELKKVPDDGDRINVIITIEDMDETGRQIKLAKATKQFRWGD
ncbi:MAG: hypothetical protein C4B59_05970 [Candidatus Methanogaster sp.]|uniref:Uncharacterized protein n=1 Tax=Candidatus Methanogaster sp. TaxID=3386292 RepID=A0AC61L3T7_9EURY|nr:MAG: hypothetical protein C4B59_05970 [ANME-2 cluster archaeon]